MFTTKQYRAKAVENGELVKTSIDPNQRRDFQKIEQSFTVLADNEQWLANNYQNSLRASEQDPNGATLAELAFCTGIRMTTVRQQHDPNRNHSQ